MSAFIVDDITINRILYTLNHLGKADTFALKPLAEIGYTEFDKRLGQDMLELNYRSVNQRYGEDKICRLFRYKVTPCTRVQAFKSLNCFQYQSCEGDCDKDPLFIALERTSDLLAYLIVTRSDEYDKADWG